MDFTTLIGLAVGLLGIVGGMFLEGGHIGSLVQATAAIIVLGGTVGAVMVSTNRHDLKMGLSLLKLGFGNGGGGDNPEVVVKELIEAAQIARKESLLALEPRVEKFTSPFMRNVFRFVVDGVDPVVLRDLFETKLSIEEENLLAGAKIYTDAGGYSPTIGIIGAVLGLIHVMENLTDTSKLGSGIAVAFVATVYGVGSANLLFLPLGSKIKRKVKEQIELKAMIVEGAVGIMNGLNPFVIEEKVRSCLPGHSKDGQRSGSSPVGSDKVA
jgi:chemotaxis protein MotA